MLSEGFPFHQFNYMHLSDCGPLVTPGGSTNGTASDVGSVRILTCNVSYTLQGDGIIRCGEDGWWNLTSTCTIKSMFVSVPTCSNNIKYALKCKCMKVFLFTCSYSVYTPRRISLLECLTLILALVLNMRKKNMNQSLYFIGVANRATGTVVASPILWLIIVILQY